MVTVPWPKVVAVVNPAQALPQWGLLKGPLLPGALKETGPGLGPDSPFPVRTPSPLLKLYLHRCSPDRISGTPKHLPLAEFRNSSNKEVKPLDCS